MALSKAGETVSFGRVAEIRVSDTWDTHSSQSPDAIVVTGHIFLRLASGDKSEAVMHLTVEKASGLCDLLAATIQDIQRRKVIKA